MSSKIEYLIQDMKKLPNKIPLSKVDELCDKLKTEETIKYLQSLKKGSKPESALRESFFAGEPILKDILGELIPEASVRTGFIDYKIEDKIGRVILLELKSYYTVDKGKLKEEELYWKDHKHQIFKYISEKYRYVILTNLKQWYFFSNKQCVTEEKTMPFVSIQFDKFYEALKKEATLWDYLRYQELKTEKSQLDKRFLDSLKIWVTQLSRLKFIVSDNEKTNVIIHLINKFIFIQTLEDFRAIGRINWLYNEWKENDEKWKPRGKNIAVKKFLNDIDEFFYTYYDTELFKTNILEKIDNSKPNMENLYEKLKFVLGLNDYQRTFLGENSGIMQYDFVSIDEDILGKAYERFLADIRKEEGIYYTPKYITQYIAENTVGQQYDLLLGEIEKKLEDSDFEKCEELIEKFVTIRVLDPACGSGSFLIKALRIIWKKYEELGDLLNNVEKNLKEKNLQITNTEEFSKSEPDQRIHNLAKRVGLKCTPQGYKLKRDIISKIVLRHIHGNDKDKNALEVAKINIWLEAIKLAPDEFRYEDLHDEKHILPDLEMNLGNGDSLVGLPEDQTIKFLKDNHGKELETLFELRKQYLKDPTMEDLVDDINTIKDNLKKELDNEFRKYLEESNLPSEIFEKTKTFYWALDFWYVFFDENLEPKEKEEQGFDTVIGNPPYVSSKELPNFYKECAKKFFKTAFGQYDIYTLFIEKSLNLLMNCRNFGFIIPDAFLGRSNFEPIRIFLLNKTQIRRIDQISGVFDDPSVSNIILIYEKTYLKDNIISFSRSQSLEDFIKGAKELEEIPQNLYLSTRKHAFIFLKKKLSNIIEKISENKRKFGEIIEIHRGEELGKGSNKILDKEVRGTKKIIFGEDIKRYQILFSNHFILEQDIEKEKELYFCPKLVFRQLGEDLNVAYDEKGEFVTLQTIYNVKIVDNDYNPYYLLGILNSKLIDFYYKNYFKEKQLFPRILLENIKDLPIEGTSFQTPIIQLVQKIIDLKKLQHKFRELWRYYSRKFRNNYKWLGEILLDDKRAIQEGNFDKVWISEASVYPDEQNELLEKEFKKIRIVGEGDNKLKIYGIEGQREELLLEITTSKKEFRDIIYLELLELVDSRVKKKTLKDILSKSEISVIQPNIWEKSGNLIEGTTMRFKEWLNKQNYDIGETDIIKIDNEIQEVDNLIDAHVFKLYGLNKEEVETVLDSLNTLESIKKDILEKYDNL